MAKRRKCIGVLTRGIENKYTADVIEGIQRQAYALDYNVAVFSMVYETENLYEANLGEKNIYNLINFDLIDGFIFPVTTVLSNSIKEDIFELLKKHRKPIVCIDYSIADFPCIIVDDESAFGNIVKHLITVHGYKKIYCLTGIMNYSQSQIRLDGYKNAMEQNGLPYNKDYVFFGDFWQDAAVKLANDIHSGKVEKPEAIACQNDWMAIHLCARLAELGYKVPDDIAVTGYDGISQSRDNLPTITTYETPIISTAAKAVCDLYTMMTGEKCEQVFSNEGHIIKGQSCGCNETNSDMLTGNRERSREKETYFEYYKTGNMMEELMCAKSFDDFCEKVMDFRYIIRNKDIIDICLCKEWDSINSEENCNPIGYTDFVTPILHEKENRIPFRSQMMYPDLWKEAEYPSTYFFLPCHMNSRCFGYAVIAFENKVDSCDPVLWNWIKAIGLSLEFMRTSTCMKSLNEILRINSITDSLTGINNRQGYKNAVIEILKDFEYSDNSLFVISCDMNDLKEINDIYGHLEGDNALRTIANALIYACMKNEVYARIGGDEFIIIGSGSYTIEDIKEIFVSFNDYLNKYNTTSSKEYKVSASLGYAISDFHEGFDLNNLISTADKMMYANKALAKGNRPIR